MNETSLQIDESEEINVLFLQSDFQIVELLYRILFSMNTIIYANNGCKQKFE